MKADAYHRRALSLVQAVAKFRDSALNERLQDRLDNIRHTPTPKSAAGAYSMLGLTLIVSALAWYFGGFQIVASELPAFLKGHALELSRGNQIFATSLSVIVVSIGCAILSAVLVSCLVGSSDGEHAVAKELANMSPGNQFGNLLLVVLLEELIARWFFLGLLTKINFLSGPSGFYALFFLGNAVWAAVHLTNFMDPKDRSLWRVLPQFVAGVLFTYVFVKFGFFVGVAVHLGYNALLFSLHKREPVTWEDVAMTVYSGMLALFAYSCITKPMTDLSFWFNDSEATFVIPGWGHWDYFKSAVFLQMTLSFVFGALLFDRPLPLEEQEDKDSNPLRYLLVIAGAFLVVLSYYGLYWVSGLLTTNTEVRVILVAVLLACCDRGRSGSSVARSFWCTVPSVFVSLCVLEAVGFWWGGTLVFLSYLINLPLLALNKARVD
jgi:hypothetical protein